MSGGFLVDTNVPSELTRPSLNVRVRDWVDAQDNTSLHLSVISVGEIRKGFSLLPQSKRREQLERWLEQYLLPLFGERILAVTQAVGNRWGMLSAECQLRGTPLNTADGLIAATALEHDLAIVTRNVKDFEQLGIAIINPWNSP